MPEAKDNVLRHPKNKLKVPSDGPFFTIMFVLSGSYLVLLLGITAADFKYVDKESVWRFFEDENIIHSLKLSLFSCSLTTVLCLIVAVPIGYLLSRYNFWGKSFVDTVLDIPIMLPPIVVGISLLIFFNMGEWVDAVENFLRTITRYQGLRLNPTFNVGGVILAQFMVACAFAIRTMRTAFDEIPVRHEHVAQTLGCSKGQAFRYVILPRARSGMVASAALAWARSLGEFGPILVFAGTTRMKTEVLSTSVYLEFSVGNLAMATTISVLMIFTATAIILLIRVFGNSKRFRKDEGS